MPSGRTHDRITLLTLPLATGLTLAVTRNSALTLIVAGAFLFSGFLMGPDLDTHSIHFKRWGWFRWIWIPYRGSMHHRSYLSHGPITGTVVRVVYLLSWVAIATFLTLTLVNQVGQLGWSWEHIFAVMGYALRQYHREWMALLVGLELGAFSHYLSDWTVSAYKRVRSKGWKALIPPKPKPRRKKSSAPRRRKSR